MSIFSIVRTVEPGAQCSHPPGRTESYFFAAYRNHSELPADADYRLSIPGRTHEEARQQAHALAETFRNCCHVPGITYTVEEIDEESPDRAPLPN